MDADTIPLVGVYRGVGIHDKQSSERIEAVVKPAIERVAAMEDILQLVDVANDVRQPPEARLYAAAKVETLYELAAERRENRPRVDMDVVRASVAGLDSVKWRHPFSFCSLLDCWHDEDAVEREEPLPAK